jgi:hypothetical protein
MAARIAKAAKDAKTGRKAVQRVASQVKKAERQLDDALDKLQGVNKKTPGRKSKSDGITVGKKRTKADRRTQQTKGAAVGSGATAAGMSGNDYTAANVDLNKGKGLPVADMSETVNMKGTGSGIRYFQNGKEVRLPKNKTRS